MRPLRLVNHQQLTTHNPGPEVTGIDEFWDFELGSRLFNAWSIAQNGRSYCPTEQRVVVHEGCGGCPVDIPDAFYCKRIIKSEAPSYFVSLRHPCRFDGRIRPAQRAPIVAGLRHVSTHVLVHQDGGPKAQVCLIRTFHQYRRRFHFWIRIARLRTATRKTLSTPPIYLPRMVLSLSRKYR